MVKKLLVVVMLTAGLVLPIGPAQAHFERGGNCHIERVSSFGVITMRFVNRTSRTLRIKCVLNFNVGSNGWMSDVVAPRSWDIYRHRFAGQWSTVTITHVHVAVV